MSCSLLHVLPLSELRFITIAHLLRIAAKVGLGALLWYLVLPQVAIGLRLVLATLRMLVTRLPLIPNKDVVFAGLAYLVFGLWTRHFRKHLLPDPADLSPRSLSRAVVDHLRFKPPSEAEAWSYNVLQRIAYLAVIFVLFPLVIWTGLAMSPAVASAFPFTVTAFGGQQSARTIHFFVTVALSLFLLVHVAMVWLAGFRSRVRAMVTGRVEAPAGAPGEHA